LLALAPHGTISSFRAVNEEETQNKLLSASETSAIYPVSGLFFAPCAQSLWLMCGFGTVHAVAASLLVNQRG
jgi:hypothetical protein